MKVKNKECDKKMYMYSILPLLFIVAVVPLIVHMKADKINNSYIQYFWTGKEMADFFAYYKMQWFLIFTGIGIMIFLYFYFKGYIKLKRNPYYIPAAFFIALTIISTLVSKDISISLFGFIGRYEGAFVLIAYIIVMVLAVNMVNDEEQVTLIIKGLIVSSMIIGLIGIMEGFNIYVLTTPIIKNLILPASNNIDINVLKDIKEFYSTISHYDYAGSYFAMMFPMSLVLLIFVSGIYKKIASAVFSLIMFANMIVSGSRAGIVGGLAAIIVILIMLRKLIIRNWKFSLGVVSILILIVFAANIISSGMVFDRMGSIVTDAKSVFAPQEHDGIKDLKTGKDGASIVFRDKVLNIVFDDNKVYFKDADGKDITAEYGKNTIKLTDARYKGVSFTVSNDKNNIIMQMLYNNIKLNFSVDDKGLKLVNQQGQPVNLKPIQKWGFEGLERIGSARGYIWSRSIPLLKNTIIAGYGPDTFAINFPQDDYVGKLNAYDTIAMFVDKAHNMYLATAINTGVISLLALLTIFGMYFISSFKTYYKCDFKDTYSYIGLAIFAAFLGYTVSGFFNDSVIAVAPVFWVLLGVGISINDIIKKRTA